MNAVRWLAVVGVLVGGGTLAYKGATELTYRNATLERLQPMQNHANRLPRQVINDRGFRQYARVERTDGTYRLMFIDEASIAAFARDGTLPEGAFIVMETYYSPNVESTNFTKERRSERWQYGSFSPERPTFGTRPDPSCQACHTTSSRAVGGTFTLPMLEAAVRQGRVMTTTCDRGGRTPCQASVYENFK